MNVLISALKKDGGKFEKVVDFNPALISLGDTVQEVIGNATFHEWDSVLVEFDYKEARAVNTADIEARVADIAEGIPADSVAFTKPPEFA